MDSPINISISDKVKFLSKGTYGCVFNPGPSCKSGKTDNKKFIRKLQEENVSSKNEENIGRIIKNIKHQSSYFAPIINSCPISFNTIENEEIKQCDIIKEIHRKYMSYKIRYVGKQTLYDYLTDLYLYQYKNRLNTKAFLNKLIYTYTHILDGVQLLDSKHILHMDLKENNIMIDDATHKPIIIDFGLSLVSSDFLTDNTQKIFGSDMNGTNLCDEGTLFGKYFFTYEDYAPWCFEINLINYIMRVFVRDNNNSLTSTINSSFLESICKTFINESYFLNDQLAVEHNNSTPDKKRDINSMFSRQDLDAFLVTLQTFVKKFADKPVKDVLLELLQTSNTWDNYSVAIIFYEFVKEKELDNINSDYLQKYVSILRSIILSSPDKRPTCLITKKEILNISSNVAKTDINNFMDTVFRNVDDSSFVEKVKEKLATHKLDTLRKEALIYDKKIKK
jgi:serine/threonine protein kinase